MVGIVYSKLNSFNVYNGTMDLKRILIVAVCGDGPMVEVAVKDYRNVLTNKNNCANKALQIY